MQLECPATVLTGASGELLCQDATTAPVAWLVTPSFQISDLNSTDLGAAWSIGFGIVVTCWLLSKAVGVVLEAIRKW